MFNRLLLSLALFASVSSSASSATAADEPQRLYAFETLSPAAVSQGSLAWGEDERPLKLDGFFGLAQYYKAPGTNAETLVSTPLCLNNTATAIGHAFAKKSGGVWKTFCRTAKGDLSGATLLKPTGQQLTRMNFIPFTAGSPLPAKAAAIAKDAIGVDLFVCRVVTPLAGNKSHIAIGTLQFDGKCVTAPGYLGAPASKEETTFELMVTAANPAPAVGWIYLKAKGHQPRGSLVQWPNGATYCQGRASGLDSHGSLEVNPDGSVEGCHMTLRTGSMTGIVQIAKEGIKVFRNDAQSNVAFGSTDDPNVPAVVVGNMEACAVFKGGNLQTRGVREVGSEICITGMGPFSRKANGTEIRSLRRKGNWPDQG